MSLPFKVHELLKGHGDDLAELEAFARSPGRTIDECHEWLQARGYTLSRGAVGNWKREFDGEVQAERMNGAGAVAKAVMEAAKSGGGVQISDAATLQVAQRIFERLSSADDVDTKELNALALALQRVSLAKVRIEDVRSEYEDREKRAVDAASKVAKEGGNPTSVVDAVRQALGLAQVKPA